MKASRLWPSDDFIQDIFLDYYKTYEHIYKFIRSKIKCKIMSADHTFRSANSLGKTVNRKWIKKAKGLYFVLNEYGQVMGYRFTKNLKFNDIEDLFQNVKNNMDEGEEVLCMLDNCCSYEKNLKGIFKNKMSKPGLDLFHAVTRVTKTIPKTHKKKALLCRQWALVFREHNDLNTKKRRLPTPSTDIILKNCAEFKRKYKWCLSNKTIDAIKKVEVHIRKGCLSNIPVKAGTNKNERLHGCLNHGALCLSKLGKRIIYASSFPKQCCPLVVHVKVADTLWKYP